MKTHTNWKWFSLDLGFSHSLITYKIEGKTFVASPNSTKGVPEIRELSEDRLRLLKQSGALFEAKSPERLGIRSHSDYSRHLRIKKQKVKS